MFASTCPPDAYLRQYLLGRVADPEARELDEHLERCALCCRQAETHSREDDLLRWIRASGAVGQPHDRVLDQLRQQLRNLPVPSTANTASNAAALTGTSAAAGAVQDVLALLAPAQASDELGRLGGYRVLRVLGVGGMGVVFEAEDVALKRRVALKAMQAALRRDRPSRERFLREARTMATLSHDNIAAVYQVDEEGSLPFLAMPLLQGESLEARLAREGALPAAEVIRIGRETALGLAAAHERGVIHRDVKPANLWLEAPAGRVKILDFGLARPLDVDTDLTLKGMLLGTPGYMAPEQFDGRPSPLSDLFSLGCVLYRAATGKSAFPGTRPSEILAAALLQQPTPPRQLNPDLPPSLEVLILRLLEKDPARRPQAARETAERLAALGSPASEARPPLPRPAPARPGRWRWAAAALLLLAGALAAVLLPRRSDDLSPPLFSHPYDKLRQADVAPSERFAGEPGALVAVLGSSGWRHCGPHGEQSFPRLAFSPDGKRASLLSYVRDTIRVTDAATGKELVRFRRPRPLAPMPTEETGAAFSLDGRLVALMSGTADDWSWTVWEVSTGKMRSIVVGAHYPPTDLRFSPGGKLLAAVGQGFVTVYDASTGKRVAEAVNDPGAISTTRAEFSPDGKLLASATTQREGDVFHYVVRVWDVAAKKESASFRSQPGSTARVVAVSPHGRWLAVGGSGAAPVQVWDLAAGKPWAALPAQDDTGRGAVAFSPDGKLLACGDLSNTIRLYDLATGKVCRSLPDEPAPEGLVFSPDGRTLASLGYTGPISLWDVESGKRRNAPAEPFRLAAASDNGTLALFGPTPQDLLLYDAVKRKVVRRLTVPKPRSFMRVSLSPDGKYLASVVDDDRIQVWEPGKDDAHTTLKHTGVQKLTFTGNGRALVSTSVSGVPVKLWDAPLWEERRVAAWPAGDGAALAFSPDGTAARAAGDTVRLEGLTTGKVTARFTAAVVGGHGSFSRDGKRLLLAPAHGLTAFLVPDTMAAKPLVKIDRACQGWLAGLSFGADDQTALIVGQDGHIVRWHGSDNRTEWQLPGPIFRAEVIGSGRYLVTSNTNGTIYLFRLPVR